MFCVCHAFLSVHCSLVVTCLERANLLAYLCVMFIPPANFVCSYTPANFVCRGYTVFTLSVRPSFRPSITLGFLNNSKSHCRIFIKPCKHVHICKTNTLDKKVRARGQFY